MYIDIAEECFNLSTSVIKCQVLKCLFGSVSIHTFNWCSVCVQCLKKSTVFLFVITTFLNGVRCVNEVVGEYGAALRQPDGFIVFTSSLFPPTHLFIYLSRETLWFRLAASLRVAVILLAREGTVN